MEKVIACKDFFAPFSINKNSYSGMKMEYLKTFL